ncbi:hypothetical protein BDU57DRAFT_564457, partial [Ampelomyces quisqualis]
MIARTHQHIPDITRNLEECRDRDTAKSHLKSLFSSQDHRHEDKILNKIDLAARVYKMINMGGGKYAISGHCRLEWQEGNLNDFLSDYFDQKSELDRGSLKLELVFKDCKLRKIAGIKIQWTGNSMGHLRLVDEEDKVVAIFHHAPVLNIIANTISQIFPLGLVEETLRTIALLFPQNDRETKGWFRKLPIAQGLDKLLLKCGSLRLDDWQFGKFHFWHDRLVILNQASVRCVAARRLDTMVVRQAKWSAMIYFRGSCSRACSHHLLWGGAKHRRSVADI